MTQCKRIFSSTWHLKTLQLTEQLMNDTKSKALTDDKVPGPETGKNYEFQNWSLSWYGSTNHKHPSWSWKRNLTFETTYYFLYNFHTGFHYRLFIFYSFKVNKIPLRLEGDYKTLGKLQYFVQSLPASRHRKQGKWVLKTRESEKWRIRNIKYSLSLADFCGVCSLKYMGKYLEKQQISIICKLKFESNTTSPQGNKFNNA